MGHITKQERRGLEDLFSAIDHSRYDTKIKSLELALKSFVLHLKMLIAKRTVKH